MRYPAILAVVLASLPVACNTDNSAPVGDPLDVRLLTCDGVVVGNVNVANSETTLMVTLTSSAEWSLKDIRWAVGTELRHIPQTRNGEPITGRFPLRRHLSAGSTMETWRLPLIVEPGTVLYFAVNADVKSQSDEEHTVVTTSWGEGTPFPMMKGSMYFTYTVQSAAPSNLAGLYRTQIQEEWGGDPSVDPAAAYMSANFAAAFPNGLTVGVTGGFTARFTSAAAITAFLPQNGTPGSLGRNWVNPILIGNPLAGGAVALTLNVVFDAYDPDFASGVPAIGELVVADPSSPCYGMTVNDVLLAANQILAGQTNLFTAQEINDAVLRINQNFQDGTVDLGFLSLP
jgi:hypothetical protein